MVGALPLNKFIVGVEGVVVWTVPARVGGCVDVTSCLRTTKEFLRGEKMAFLGGTNPVVVGYIQFGPRQAEGLIHSVNPGGWVCAVCFGSTRHMLAILVNPNAEVSIISQQTVETCNDIRCHFL